MKERTRSPGIEIRQRTRRRAEEPAEDESVVLRAEDEDG